MKIENTYTSVACNRTPEIVDWGNNGLIVFGACNALAIFDPTFDGSSKIISTYAQHKKRVNTVKWIKSKESPENKFISGSDDATAIIWDITNRNQPQYYILDGHTNGVTVVDAIYVGNKLTVATASTDSTIKLWEYSNDCNKYICIQTIELHGFCLALRMSTFPETNQILLAIATDDDKVTLFTEFLDSENSNKKFTKIHQLIGHEDWVRSLDFILAKNGDLMLASSSQDTFIRLWKISIRTENEVQENNLDLFNIPDGDIHVEEKILIIKSIENADIYRFAISLESVLQGHEGWVYGVHWNESEKGLQLLSSSIDKTLIVWSPTEDGVWMEKVRVGEVGGNSLGFFGGKFSSQGKSILGHGYQGSFHIWNRLGDDDNLWEPSVIVGGHFSEVRDICWEPEGKFLISVSLDQTTRIHAPWIRKNSNIITWHELARPQVHGFDMQCVAVLSRYKFASGAEEKIVRTFQAPGNFVENFQKICKITPDEDKESVLIIKNIPKGASVPSLGLSNKAVFECDNEQPKEKHVKDQYPENYFIPINLDAPPQEETLMQNTLWPEVQKLYGHGFEIFSLCSSSDGNLLASSCKATTLEHAQIIIWNTTTWKQIQKLSSHQLTVTQMKFSPNNQYLLSVSRDRRWSLFENKMFNAGCDFHLIATTDKKNGVHSRIIWSCDWAHDSKIFATSSRDGKIVIWSRNSNISNTTLREYFALDCLEFKNESVTAVAFASQYIEEKEGNYLIALGLECGLIHLYSFSETWSRLYTLEKDFAHHSVVRKLQFSPERELIRLASCGEDHFVRIFDITL